MNREFCQKTGAWRLILLAGIGLVGLTSQAALETAQDTRIPALSVWFDQPASRWEEAFPLGNGRLGAMVFGGVTNEHFQLNEDTLTSDGPGYRQLPLHIRPEFSTVTNLIAQQRFAEADRLITDKWLGRSWACYQPLGDLFLDFEPAGKIQNYRRELNLRDAVCQVHYECAGAKFSREIFASHPDEVMVIHLTCDPLARLNLRVRLTSPHANAVTVAEGAEVVMQGQLPGLVLRRTLDWVENKRDTWKYPELWDKNGQRLPNANPVLYGTNIHGRGTHFAARVQVQTQGGKVAADHEALQITGANDVVLFYSAASSYSDFDKSPGRDAAVALAKADGYVQAARQRSYSELLIRHYFDYQPLFNRVALELGMTPQSKLPTNQRLKLFANGQDPALAALYFQFGRYLMIAGSRPGSQPLNLQGIWNREIIPPWASQYTININTEMNYWPAEVGNLSECHEPLLRMIRELSVDGARVAREMYGNRGWVAHHNTTLWRDAQPVDNAAVCSFWPMGSGWLCQHLFEHYRFSGDREFLRREAYPLMKGACEFYLDWLVADAQGRLVTPVSTSPENTFVYPDKNGRKTKSSVSAGGTCDMAIIRQLFLDTIAATEALQSEDDFRARLKTTLARLLPYQVGARGQLQEWSQDFAEADPAHRHVSHLIGLHPGNQITLAGTPDLAAAAKRTLELRGDGGTGWSKAWKINFWARLQDGDHAFRMLSELLQQSTLPNLFDSCPPFQIDGNFGGTAGMAEMLLQSHADEIRLLPALPKAWPAGSVKGLRARGGFAVDIEWRDGRLIKARLQRVSGEGASSLRYGGKTVSLNLKSGEQAAWGSSLEQQK